MTSDKKVEFPKINIWQRPRRKLSEKQIKLITEYWKSFELTPTLVIYDEYADYIKKESSNDKR